MPPAAIPLIAAGVSAASAGAQYAGQQAAGLAQSKYQKDQFYATMRSAQANYYQQIAQVQNRSQQDTAQTQDQALQNALQGEGGKGTAAVSASQRGVSGTSANEALQQFARIEAQNHTNLLQSLNWRNQQAYQDEKALGAQAWDRIIGATPQPVQMPSAAAAGLQIGGAALSGYSQFAASIPQSNSGTPTAPTPQKTA